MDVLTKPAATALLTIAAAPALAQGVPGAHFIENWDADGDGQVTPEEVAAKRSEIFVMFDQSEDGVLDATEYALFDETRKADMDADAGGGLRLQPAHGGIEIHLLEAHAHFGVSNRFHRQ